MCGGTQPLPRRHIAAQGLSPRVRGNHYVTDGGASSLGSIPACAGEPFTGARLEGEWKVYPRVCGGTSIMRSGKVGCTGLSPRVRGNPSVPHTRLYRNRSIPACAGEPRTGTPGHGLSGVYPRVCGGTTDALPLEELYGGLSPRVRGNRCLYHENLERSGSIPACAGEPAPGSPCAQRPAVYPRVCGGTSISLISSAVVTGLSPRVRGNLPQRSQTRSGRRSIPACAGEPDHVEGTR